MVWGDGPILARQRQAMDYSYLFSTNIVPFTASDHSVLSVSFTP